MDHPARDANPAMGRLGPMSPKLRPDPWAEVACRFLTQAVMVFGQDATMNVFDWQIGS